ncbi:MAG: carbonic anhydrase [Planctomycetota bacterium]|jgi:carbonic anhydrase
MTSALEALDCLRTGNRRFVAGQTARDSAAEKQRRKGLAVATYPIVTILGCADPRVAPEQAFDENNGDLSVVQVAGNTALPTQVESTDLAQNTPSRLAAWSSSTVCRRAWSAKTILL